MQLHRALYIVRRVATAVVAIAVLLGAVCAADAQNDFVLNDSQFDSWVFQNRNQAHELDADSQISLAVEAVDRTCHLSEAQLDKLRLAGRGDFARFDRQVDELRAELVGRSYDQQKIGEVYQKIQPLATTYQSGLLGPSSLFAKVIHTTLTPGQWVEYDAAEKERLQAGHVAKVRLYVAILERRCPLTDEQRTALVELLVSETGPPLRSSEFDMYVVPAQAAKIAREKFTAILDKAQCHVLDKSLEQARGLEQHLKRQGVLADD